ncbi:pilus assembly protein [Corallococcus praedator]|uniref:Pilus assembly protein n=1 Tax=Corallococcus praedator TaxID=2316724 RepID=A0ABX9QLU3_9BACT|nr:MULTISPECIES: TadE family protein [Corallococcus]RKH12714.1 pilus assembly protein [Corallococcus sp. CA047B]RKH34033.1 pilus assembly protein [Corallococcus sp. CA031C]RKI11986.1 pilus assembly protein [Corallococcus praedator]
MRDRRESGQVAVETAIVLPMFVFLILGTLQLGMMHQARLMTKYAAYKAVRAGALHNANVKQMESAAIAVLLPLISSSSGGGGETIKAIESATDFQMKFAWASKNKMMDAGGLKYADVTICGPLRDEMGATSGELDFDNPSKITSTGDWAQSQRSKLRIQVTFNYRLPIPFADMVIYNIARKKEMPFVLRLGNGTDTKEYVTDREMLGSAGKYDAAAQNSVYILPIRATYTMRMQSNFYLGANPLPDTNKCVFSFETLQ